VSRTSQDRTRFAPSPTGLLHLGHAYAAINAHHAAGYKGFILRIEDLDGGRARAEFTSAIFEDLNWLGLTWELPVLSQSSRGEAYRTALSRLQERGMIYPCFCSRRQIADELSRAAEAPHGEGLEAAIYPGTCRALTGAQREQRMAHGQPYALRLDSAKAAEAYAELTFEECGHGPNGEHGTMQANPLLFGDVVLARKNLPAAYHLAVVVDDAFQGVTRVTRGNDLFSATHVQRTLQALLGLPAPRYAHHRLILDEQGRKFSKREQAVTLRCLREAGVTPAQIRSRIGAASS
jgi:glutamyl-Q tRNA(Asp) synthetase